MSTKLELGPDFRPPSSAPRPPPFVAPPPPPPPPPSPTLPTNESTRIVFTPASKATLSTLSIATAADGDVASTATGRFMPLGGLEGKTRAWALSQPHAAQCAAAATGALPCRSGDTPERCVSGARHCGTTLENTRAPWAEFDVRDDAPPDHYLFAIEFQLPVEARLFFESAEPSGGVGHDLVALDHNHNPLPVQCKDWNSQAVSAYSDGLRKFQHVCLSAMATDADYEAMRHVGYLKLTLLGEHRLLWLHDVTVLWRDGSETLKPTAPPPPSVHTSHAHAPPDPPPPPDVTCTRHSATFPRTVVVHLADEPCDLTFDECCRHLHDARRTQPTGVWAVAFEISTSGCCALFGGVDAEIEEIILNGTLTPTAPHHNVNATGVLV